MSVAFVQLSDIHFGQERDSRKIVHADVKERLVDDVRAAVSRLPCGRAAGLIVVGDIAFAGLQAEYTEAGAWLDRVAAAAGCAKTDIQMVPGNHDIDRSLISPSMKLMLADMVAKGSEQLNLYLENEADRETIYQRFAAYRKIAEAYDCPLDCHGLFAADRRVELAPGRAIRFARINSALLCHSSEKPGELLLGARQWVLPTTDGEELVVLCHHPLHWFGDASDASQYIKSRARVFVSGHEHEPAAKLETICDGCDILMIASGAAVPPKADARYNFTYNLLEFDWDPVSDALVVKVHPRAWNRTLTRFEEDTSRADILPQHFVAASPYFRAAGPALARHKLAEGLSGKVGQVEIALPVEAAEPDPCGRDEMPDDYHLVLLRFFRDLNEGQRLKILVTLGALPLGFDRALTHAVERRLLDTYVAREGTTSVAAAIADALEKRKE